MLKAPDGSPVAGVSTYPRPVDGRLIAAAPEMLELLRHLAGGPLRIREFQDEAIALVKRIDG
jgi:hypothetical protein